MSLSKSIVAIVILSIFVPAVCQAELGEAPMPKIAPKKSDGPSLEETFQWISRKLETSDVTETMGKHAKVSQFRASFNNCSMTYVMAETEDWHWKETKMGGRSAYVTHPGETNIFVVSLKDINTDATSLRTTPFSVPGLSLIYLDANWQQESDKMWIVHFDTIGQAKTIQHSVITSMSLSDRPLIDDVINGRYVISDTQFVNRKELENAGGMSMKFFSEDSAASMVNALKHAALLCRQKEAEGRAAQPAKPKDLF